VQEPTDPVEVLTRWELSGGAWSVVSRTRERVVVALLRCDGGEEVDRFVSARSDLLAFLGQRTDSED
jgi:hypothetical protein